MKKPKICLVEPCDGHDIVILPQIELLREDYDIYVLAPRPLLERDLLRNTRQLYQGIPVAWNQRQPRWRRLLRMPSKYRDFRRIVDSIRPEVVLFNSTYLPIDLLLIARYFKGVRKAQIIHHFHYFLRPGMRWLYDQFDLSLVISEEVHGYIVRNHPQYSSLDYFLPIYFNSFQASSPAPPGAPLETDGRLQIGVFGAIDQFRRNYKGLLNSLAKWGRRVRAPKFVMHLVGGLPAEYKRFIIQHDLGQMVRCYEGFVPYEEMFRVLRNVDIVMFLIDATVPNCKLYNHYKISGTSLLIKGFQKVCAASRDFRVDAILADKCFFYDGAQVEQLFESIEDGSINKATVRAMEASYENAGIFSREQQKARLVGGLQRK